MGTQAIKIMLTDRAIKALKPAPAGKRMVAWDSVVPHLCIRVTDKGAKSFMVRKRMAGAKNPVENVLGTYPALSLIDARKRARDALGLIAEGINPKKQEREDREAAAAKQENNFEAVAKAFKKGHARKNRSGFEAERIIDLYLIPRFGRNQMGEIKRRDIAKLLDEIEHRKFKAKGGRVLGGAVMADHVLAQLRKLMNWYATRDDDFTSPIVPGMGRTKPKERARGRVLSDEEIYALWMALDKQVPKNALSSPDLWAAFVQVLFLSARRRDEVAGMKRSEIKNGVWEIPAARHKTGKDGKPLIAALPKTALAIIAKRPQIDDSDLVFTTTGKTAFSGFSKSKTRLDRTMLAELKKIATVRRDSQRIGELDEVTRLLIAARKGDQTAREKLKTAWWTLHDLRRTAKTLMARAGVLPHISERVLGHVISGVEGVYDKFEYIKEKKDAVERLAALVQKITKSPSEKVSSV